MVKNSEYSINGLSSLIESLSENAESLTMMAVCLEYEKSATNDLDADYYEGMIVDRSSFDSELIWELASALHNFLERAGILP